MSSRGIPESWRDLFEDPTAVANCYLNHTKNFNWPDSEHERRLVARLASIFAAASEKSGKISTRVFENELLGHLGSVRHESLHSSTTTLSPEQAEDRKREEFDTEIYEHKSYRSVP